MAETHAEHAPERRQTASRQSRTPVRLPATVDVVGLGDGVLLSRGRQALKVRGPQAWLAGALEQLRAGTAQPAAGSALGRLVGELGRMGWITTEPAPPPAAYDGLPHQRQLGYLELFGPEPVRMQRRLDTARVAVVGIGGIGALAAREFVAAGLRELWLIDPDRVETHNLNRQHLYTLDDVGTPKVNAAAARLRALAPDVRVTGNVRRVLTPEDLDILPDGIDLLVLGADTPAGITEVCWTWAAARGSAITSAAVGLDSGYWGPLLDPALGHCLRCFEEARRGRCGPDELRLEDADTTPTPYSFGPSNSAIAALLAHDALRWLASGTALTLGARGLMAFDTGRLTRHAGPDSCRCRADDRSTDC
ncbi:ThiF family adenylyltransferase [Streptomyces sp. KM273126]|uniref:ThiF family adenylyltransferase n=1 Tax=Streptomyces sp. KM273126 TaxID=2545247 RepID=UPI001038FFF8|nr:ThiF family adenylyltransferase [Streptomyces sp. KM273126]MBA2808636.1 ThiF family adenylyltransferase [Streptomyces sp. KM273126]